MIAATFDLSSKVRVELMKSLSSRVESWKESWMWSSPAAFSALRAALGQPDAGGDEVGVEAEPARMGDQLLQVVAQQRLAAREAELHRAEGARLGRARASRSAVSSSSWCRA